MSNETYPQEFFQHLQKCAESSAKQVVPVIMDLFSPVSVVDVGCGTGTWLSSFQAQGVADVIGLDGDHVPREMLQIPERNFLAVDLSSKVKLTRKFDLVVSLEVAEHLPPESANTFVETLVNLGDVVVFSAAIPFQGGDGHINEQWPAYWARLFEERGFEFSNCLRNAIWEAQDVEWWYAQNIMVFFIPDVLQHYKSLEKATLSETNAPLSLVHPKHYSQIKWDYMVLEAALDIVDLIPLGETFVFVDNDQTYYQFEPARRVLRLPTAEQWYWQVPADEAAAIVEFENFRLGGASYFVIVWPAFWWLDGRREVRDYLNSNYNLLLENDRVLVFGLRSS